MVTIKTLTSDIKQVERLIKWWISQSKQRYHRVRKAGTVEDFVNDVWARLLRDLRDGKEIDCNLSTVVCQACAWELGSYRRIADGERRAPKLELLRKLRYAEKLQSHHRIGSDKYLLDEQENKALAFAIAALLRSLTWREAVIVRAQFGLLGDPEMTLEQIARPLKITRERVRQIGMKGVKKLQHHTRAYKLLPFAPNHIDGIPKAQQPLPENVIKRLKRTECGKILLDELIGG
jgi:RNA polymerase sigma factor (sigma-70 family)